MKTTRSPMCLAGAVFMAVVATEVAAGQEPTRPGEVFTAVQAERGRQLYDRHCSSCHMDDLSGGGWFGLEDAPALKAEGVVDGRDLASLFSFVKMAMPADSPGALDDKSYVDVIAYLLQANGYSAGVSELKADLPTLRAIRLAPRR